MPEIREILVLHHSHLDVGYTHSQPIVRELHREYIDQALEMLSETADWPEHSRPKWTCEVTSPVMHWMETADEKDLQRFQTFLSQGRLGVSAMQYNTSPLCSAELLSRQLAPLGVLRSRFGVPIVTLNQHDVNGVQWPLADLMIDAGIELLTMAANIDNGHFVSPRPGVFFWTAPSGRRLLVMNGNHYTMFDQLLWTWENSIDRMREGLASYCARLEQSGYPHDFIYLTTTNSPEAWDNSPPNPWVARLIRQWNESVDTPLIRYVTPADLLERLHKIAPASLPVLNGDWTDYWSFGNGSTAYETAVSRKARFALQRAELLGAARVAEARGTTIGGPPRGTAVKRVSDQAWADLALFCEHTWTYWDPAPELPPARAQSALKTALAHQARERAEYLLISELETLSANPAQSARPDHLLILNPVQRARRAYVRVPDTWKEPGKSLRSVRFTWAEQAEGRARGVVYGPFELPAFGWMKVPLSGLAPATPDSGLALHEQNGAKSVIESPFHRLSFDPATGRVTSLLDKILGWEVLPRENELSFFDFVHERPDPLFDGTRKAFYERDLEREKLDQHCWKTQWRAERRRASRLLSCGVEQDEASITFVRQLEAPGVRSLRQRITLRADSPVIELEAALDKLDCKEPEAIYFAFPLNLPGSWQCLFDTAGVPVELDKEQLPGCCRGWMSVDTFAALQGGGRSAALICPDSALIQAGGFGFGRLLGEVQRPEGPLLLAWPMNNYWYTNYPLTQPGLTGLRYGFLTSAAADPAGLMQSALELVHPLLVHPASAADGARKGRLLVVEGEGVLINHAKPAADGRGIMLRLACVGRDEATARLRAGGAPVRAAFLCGTLEDDREALPVVDGMAEVRLRSRCLTLVRLCT